MAIEGYVGIYAGVGLIQGEIKIYICIYTYLIKRRTGKYHADSHGKENAGLSLDGRG